MAPHIKKIKTIEFGIGETGTETQFECQVSAWTLTNNTPDPEPLYTQCPDGQTFEEVDPEYALELTFFADWRSDGISDFLWKNDGTDMSFTLVHHPGSESEVSWTGTVRIKAPSVGGEARANEQTEVTLQIIGKPTYTGPTGGEV